MLRTASKRRNIFVKNAKQETTEIVTQAEDGVQAPKHVPKEQDAGDDGKCIGGWLNEGGAASGRRRRKATASQPVSSTPPALQGVIQHSDLERRRPDAFTPKKPPRWFKESIGGWLNEGGAASGRRRRKATASQPVSCTPPALQGVIQHSDLERRRPDAFTPKKPPRWFKERTAAHHTFGHLPDYTDESKSAATVDREALVNMNAHMGIGGWLNEGGAASGRRRRKATASQPVSSTPPALQGVIQHSDLERRRPDAFTPKKPPRWFKERTAAHHTFGHLPDYTDETKNAATLDREALVKMNAHISMSGRLNEGGATSGRRRRKATASQPVSSTPPALQGVIQNSDLERRRPDAFTPKKPPRWFKESYPAQTQIPMPKEPEFLDYMTKRPRRKPTGYMGNRRFLSTRYEPGNTVDDEIKEPMSNSYPEQTHLPMPKEPEFLDYMTKRPRRKSTGYMGNRRFLSTRYEPGNTVDDEIKELMSNSYPEQTHLPMPEKHKFLHYMTKRPRRKPTGYMGNRRFLSRRYEPGNTVDDEIKEPMSNSYPEQTHLPMPKEPEFLDYMTKRPRRKPTGYMGNRRFLSTRYEPGNTVDDEIKEPMSNSYPEQTHLPMPKEPEFLDYMTKRPRRKSTGYMGNRRFLSTRYEPGNTVDDEIKELMSNSYPEQTHLPMPEKHKFLHYMTKRPRRKPTGYMGNRRFLSRRYEPGNTVDDEIKEPMSNSYPEQTHLPMPKEPEFLDYMTKRPRRKPTGYMGNRRFLSTGYEPGNTVDDEIKEPMSNSYPEQTHLPMPEKHKFLHYKTRRRRRKPTKSMGNRRFLSTRFGPGDTVGDVIKEPMSESYPEQSHLPMPEKHKFLHHKTRRRRRKPTKSMGNRRFLSTRFGPGVTVGDVIKVPMSESYPEQSHLPMPEKHKFLHHKTRRRRRKPTKSMGNRRFLSTRFGPGDTVGDVIKEPMSNREKRTMGVNWNDWYSPIYDRSNRWLSSLVRKLPFSFDPKELKIIYPNNKKDTLYTPYTNLKAGEKKSRPLSLTTTMSTTEADSTSDRSKQTICLSPQLNSSSAKPSCDCCSCAGRQSTLLTTQAGIIEQSSLQHHKGLISPIIITRSPECRFPGFGVSRTPLPQSQTIATPATPALSQMNPSQNHQQTAPQPNMTNKNGQDVPCPYCNNPIFLSYIPLS